MKVNQIEDLIGRYVAVWCGVYIYSGKLVSVDSEWIVLENAGVVYTTGPLLGASFTDFQPLPGEYWLVRSDAVESAGLAPQHPDAGDA
jgi:hypothetical protein